LGGFQLEKQKVESLREIGWRHPPDGRFHQKLGDVIHQILGFGRRDQNIVRPKEESFSTPENVRFPSKDPKGQTTNSRQIYLPTLLNAPLNAVVKTDGMYTYYNFDPKANSAIRLLSAHGAANTDARIKYHGANHRMDGIAMFDFAKDSFNCICADDKRSSSKLCDDSGEECVEFVKNSGGEI
jgi:hypothetical protein